MRKPRGTKYLSSLVGLVAAVGLVVIEANAPAWTHSFEDLPDTIEAVRPAVVGIGTYQRTRAPTTELTATGFVVADGRHVVTNAHALKDSLNREQGEHHSIFVGRGNQGEARRAEPVLVNRESDLAILRIQGDPLPSLTLGNANRVREGDRLAFTGYPIGLVLGLYPATHRGMVAAITPLAAPARQSQNLDARTLRQLRGDPPGVFQLDATAYPGNSGSPLYEPDTGEVVGIINRVFIQRSREQAISDPSGISYAVPVSQLKPLLREADLR